MKNLHPIIEVLENAVSLIPQQAFRFLAYSLVTMGIIKGYRFLEKKFNKD